VRARSRCSMAAQAGPTHSVHGASDDDVTALRRHGSLEVASMRSAVLREIRRSYETLRAQEADEMIETLLSVIDSAIGSETVAVVAFQQTMIERLLQATGASIDWTVLADRAAVLQVRLALEHNDLQPSTLVVPTRQSGRSERPNKGRGPVCVRWSLASGEPTDDAAPRRSLGSNQPLAGSRLSMHAIETLRGSVAAIEHEQTPNGSSSQPHRTRTSSLDSDDSLMSSIEGSASPAWVVASTMDSCEASFRNDDVTDTATGGQQAPSSEAASSCASSKSKWEVARNTFLGKPPAATVAPKRGSTTAARRATIRRCALSALNVAQPHDPRYKPCCPAKTPPTLTRRPPLSALDTLIGSNGYKAAWWLLSLAQRNGTFARCRC
jgi:hypothetical protein